MTKEEYEEYTKEWEAWSSSQGGNYSTTDKIMDQQTTYTVKTQLNLYTVATQTIQDNMSCRDY